MEPREITTEYIEKYAQLKKEYCSHRVRIGNLIRLWVTKNMEDWQTVESWDICDNEIEIIYSDLDFDDDDSEYYVSYNVIKIPIDKFITEVNSYLN